MEPNQPMYKGSTREDYFVVLAFSFLSSSPNCEFLHISLDG